MALTVSVHARARHQQEWATRTLAGLRRHGLREVAPRTQADVVLVWGVKNREPWRFGRVLVMERAYLGNRFEWTSLGWNGLNGSADFCNSDVPPDRWQKYWAAEMRDEKPGDGVLVIGQVDGDASLKGVNAAKWADAVGKELTTKGVRWSYRQHPKARSRQPWPADQRPLEVALAACDKVITYTSNVGVLAAMEGKRVTAEEKTSMVWAICGRGFRSEQPLGDRSDWGRKLAYCQWTPDELERGEFWDTLKNGVLTKA